MFITACFHKTINASKGSVFQTAVYSTKQMFKYAWYFSRFNHLTECNYNYLTGPKYDFDKSLQSL